MLYQYCINIGRVMAYSRASSASAKSFNNCLNNVEFSTLHIDKDCKELINMVYDGKRLKWINDLKSLKKIIEESFGLRGKWSSPGGDSKRFKSTNANLSITWYYKKQNTLLFQGKDGNSLREKCILVCQMRSLSKPKSPKKANVRENILLVSPDGPACSSVDINAKTVAGATVTSTSNSSGYEDKAKTNSDSINTNSSLLTSCHCLCGSLATELEGVKLDIVILQKGIDSIADITTRQPSGTSIEVSRLQRELLEEKDKTKRLEADLHLVVRERNNEVNDLKRTINSLENKIVKNEETNDSLRVALNLIMQDNNIAHANDEGQRSSNLEQPWIPVNNKAPLSSNKSRPLPQVKTCQPKLKGSTNENLKQNLHVRPNNRFSVLKDQHNSELNNQVVVNESDHCKNQQSLKLRRNENSSGRKPCTAPQFPKVKRQSHERNLHGSTKLSDEKPVFSTSQSSRRPTSGIELQRDKNLPLNRHKFKKSDCTHSKIKIGDSFLNAWKTTTLPKERNLFHYLKSLVPL